MPQSDRAADVEVLTPRRGSPPGKGLQEFAKHGEPGGPGRCLWCGKRLLLAKIANHPTITEHRGQRGDYADNAFCGLRCGYLFGRELAVLGRRLQVTPPAPAHQLPVEPAGPES
jgi:hypothetical protein